MKYLYNTLDCDGKRILDTANSVLMQPWECGLREQILLCASFVHNDLTPYVFGVNDTFTFAVDNDFNDETKLMVEVENDAINVDGDWASASKVGGKLSIRIDCDNATFKSKLGTKENIPALPQT